MKAKQLRKNYLETSTLKKIAFAIDPQTVTKAVDLG